MAAKKAGKAPKKAGNAKKNAGKKKLECDDCGMVVVVENACGCGCVPTCCGTEMKKKK
jgi:hypothetical protein